MTAKTGKQGSFLLLEKGGDKGSYVARAGLELSTLFLPQPPESWDHRCVPPCLIFLEPSRGEGCVSGWVGLVSGLWEAVAQGH